LVFPGHFSHQTEAGKRIKEDLGTAYIRLYQTGCLFCGYGRLEVIEYPQIVCGKHNSG
jgi:hypothetical protein